VAVRSNRPAALPQAGFTDCELNVEFAFDQAKLPGKEYIEFSEGGVYQGPAYVRRDGKRALISVASKSLAESAVQIRRVVPFAAALQGLVTLHASAVEINGNAVCFVACSGAGKSTLANRINAIGGSMLADDLLPCRIGANGVFVPVSNALQKRALALGAVYFLARDRHSSHLATARLSSRQFLRLLIYNGFGEIRDRRVWKTQFNIYGLIATLVVGYTLIVPDDLAILPMVAKKFLDFEFDRQRGDLA
jgi:hypothetical protein